MGPTSSLTDYYQTKKLLEENVRKLKEIYESLPEDIQATTYRPSELLSQIAPLCRCSVRG